MTASPLALLIEAALFGVATAGVVVALGLAGIAAWQVWQAVYSPMAKRRQRAKANSRKRVAHYRKILGLTN